jgi:hypothetical protein
MLSQTYLAYTKGGFIWKLISLDYKRLIFQNTQLSNITQACHCCEIFVTKGPGRPNYHYLDISKKKEKKENKLLQ